MCEKPFQYLANCIQKQNMESLEAKHAKNLEHKIGKWNQEIKRCDEMNQLLKQRQESLRAEETNLRNKQRDLVTAEKQVIKNIYLNNVQINRQTESEEHDHALGLSSSELLNRLKQCQCSLQEEQTVIRAQQNDLPNARLKVSEKLATIKRALLIVDCEKSNAILKLKKACVQSRLRKMKDAIVVNNVELQDTMCTSVQQLLDSLRSDASAAASSEASLVAHEDAREILAESAGGSAGGSAAEPTQKRRRTARYPPILHIPSCLCAGCFNHPRTNKLMGQKLQD